MKTHINRLFAKLELRDRAQAVIAAYELGLVRAGRGAGERVAGGGPANHRHFGRHSKHGQRVCENRSHRGRPGTRYGPACCGALESSRDVRRDATEMTKVKPLTYFPNKHVPANGRGRDYGTTTFAGHRLHPKDLRPRV